MVVSAGLKLERPGLNWVKGRVSEGAVVVSEVRHDAQTERKARRAEGLAMLGVDQITTGSWVAMLGKAKV